MDQTGKKATGEKILEFPVHKVQLQKKAHQRRVQMERVEKRNLLVSTVLLSIVLAVVSMNHLVSQDLESQMEVHPSSGQRGIASVNDQVYEREMVKKLSQRAMSSVSRRGVRPSELDHLTFGVLQGKYSVNLKSGKIASIYLSEENQAQEISNYSDFVKNMRSLLPVSFSRVDKVSSSLKTKGEVYALLDKQGAKVGVVTMMLDEKRRLLSLQFQEASQMAENAL